MTKPTLNAKNFKIVVKKKKKKKQNKNKQFHGF